MTFPRSRSFRARQHERHRPVTAMAGIMRPVHKAMNIRRSENRQIVFEHDVECVLRI